MTWPRQLICLLLAFALGSAIAGLLGAVNLGVALSVGTLCFMATLVYLILSE
ncbi:MAG: hypothetical protein QOE75_2073 [Solirubrobacterales bacterium]|jgi:hypothetical protein|nr:hypothetical protein [Solirubrobacterales bacterium]